MKLQRYLFVSLMIISFPTGLSFAEDSPWQWGNSSNQDNAAIHYGPTKINNKTLEDLTVFGPAYIINSTISHAATVKGTIEAERSSLNSLYVDGMAKLDRVKIKDLYINGPIYAVDSVFDEISIASEELKLSNSKVTKLSVRSNRNPKRQIVYLDKGTQVETLSFEAKNGLVVLGDRTAAVNKLVGGEIESK